MRGHHLVGYAGWRYRRSFLRGRGWNIDDERGVGLLSGRPAVTVRIFFALLLLLFPGASLADCPNPNAPGGMNAEGVIVYNSDYETMQFCDGSVWWDMRGSTGALPSCPEGETIVMASSGWTCGTGGSGSACPNANPVNGSDPASGVGGGMWKQGNYVYLAEGAAGVAAFSFNGTAWTHLVTYNTTGTAKDVWSDGTHIYVADGASGIHALTFDGTVWTFKATYDTAGDARAVWGDGTHIYVADGTSGVHALTFDGTAWTFKATYNSAGTGKDVWGDGTHIYVADGGPGVHALTFDGTAWTFKATHNTAGTAEGVWGDGTYVYVTDGYEGLIALTFNGTTWSQLAIHEDTLDYAGALTGVGGITYVGSGSKYVAALSFNGTSFEPKGYYPAGEANLAQVHSDGNYVYLSFSDASGMVRAFPACGN